MRTLWFAMCLCTVCCAIFRCRAATRRRGARAETHGPGNILPLSHTAPGPCISGTMSNPYLPPLLPPLGPLASTWQTGPTAIRKKWPRYGGPAARLGPPGAAPWFVYSTQPRGAPGSPARELTSSRSQSLGQRRLQNFPKPRSCGLWPHLGPLHRGSPALLKTMQGRSAQAPPARP